MYNAGKFQAPRNIRLPKQSAAPTYQDIEFLMQEAVKTTGRTVELPWFQPENKKEFVLTVKQVGRDSDPLWVMYESFANGNQQAIWNYESRDVPLITNLVVSSCGTELVDVMPTSALTGRSQENQDKLNKEHAKGNEVSPILAPAAAAAAAATPAKTSDGEIRFEPPKPNLRPTMEGDLKNIQVPGVMQSISLSKMTGRLDVKTGHESCEVYFQEGIPLHCALNNTTGDSALIELVTWQQGEFRFWPDEKSFDRTINKRLETIVMEGATLLDQTKYLETAGLKFESCLVKKNAMISEDEFAARVNKGTPMPLPQQLDFYELIDNRNTLFELLRHRPMHKTQWVPIVFNLVSCGLVSITDQAPTQNRLAKLRSLGVDEAAVQNVVKAMIKPETGILSFPAFIHILDQEYMRYEHFNFPFSLIIFSIGQRKGGPDGVVEALQMLAVRRAMQRISLVKRAVDLLGHYETFDYAMLLPNTNSAAASALASRIADVLREAPLSSDMDSRSLALAFGVATVPEDCQELDKVVLLARKARDKSKFTQQRVVLAREILTQGPV
jgi:GGDEF domain-containing protein